MGNISTVKRLIEDAEAFASEGAKDRLRAMEYYRGVMTDTPSDEGRSSMATRDVRAHIKKVLPSITRTILGGENIVEYQPANRGDEDAAAQASDYINRVLAQECNLASVIYDAVHDALLLRNGIIRWWWDEREAVKISRHTGLDDAAFARLAGDDAVEVLEHSERVEMIDTPQGPAQIAVHDCKLRRTYVERRARVASVPRERFLIHRDAVRLQDAILIGERSTVTRGELVAMGYDRDAVAALPVSGEDDVEDMTRRDIAGNDRDEEAANQELDYYDLFVRTDADGDGVAELRHMVFAGKITEASLLIDEECDDIQFADVKVMAQPHQWEGISLFDDLADLQRAKTVLLRETLDNIYWQNKPQPVMQDDAVVNPDAVFNPEFGLPIRVKRGIPVAEAYGFKSVPFVAQQSFGMLEYIDTEAADRTGITDASSGLAPDAMQNMTAKASSMIEAAGIGQTEMMVRTVAQGLRDLFRGLLRLIIRHQDVPRTVRLRDEWVDFDPRQWNADMDCVVNVGLGAGTRERDMMMMQQVLGLQEKLLASMGANNPFVKPENLWASISRLVEAAGLKTASLYFTEPDPQETAALMQAQAQRPDPAMQKVQAQMQDAQARLQMEQVKMQMEAKIASDRLQAEIALKREQMQAEFALKREQMALEAAMRGPAMGGDVRFGGEVG